MTLRGFIDMMARDTECEFYLTKNQVEKIIKTCGEHRPDNVPNFSEDLWDALATELLPVYRMGDVVVSVVDGDSVYVREPLSCTFCSEIDCGNGVTRTITMRY